MEREGISLDWCDTQAPICDSRGRLWKYSRDFWAGILEAVPWMVTWRSMTIQGKRMETLGFMEISLALREV